MGWFDDDKNEEDRSHQDNFRGHDNSDNGSYQYCKYCECMRRFIWDRCEHCKNN